MTLRKPGKVTILPAGLFNPEAATPYELAAGVEIGEGWADTDTPIIELGDGIEAVFIANQRALYDLRSSEWTEKMFHILKFKSQIHGVMGRGRPEERLYAPVGTWVVKSTDHTFKVLSQESFDALREVILKNRAEAAVE